MENNNFKAQNPMSEYLLKIQLIVSNTEFKNNSEANKYETLDINMEGNKYVNAVLKKDIFESYTYPRNLIYDMLKNAGVQDEKIIYYIDNPVFIPNIVKMRLLENARNNFINKYKEQNKYYINLSGMPFLGNDKFEPDKILLIPDEFYYLYESEGVLQRNQPIHEMPLKYQELFMNSDFYKMMLNDNSDVTYLKYIGSNSIPIEVSRSARDGDILRINTNKLSTYNDVFGNITVTPDIIHKFTNVYKSTRDYVYNTLRGDFSNIYTNYDSFIRFLTIYLSIGNTLNDLMKQSSSLIYMNNVTANNFFMLYGLPSVIMEGNSMIDFLKKFRMILQDKGTNVVYRVKDLIGYEYTDIYTLIMVKQQKFENGIPVYNYETGKPECEIVFRRLGTADDNTSYFKYKESAETYDWRDIQSGDPRWWNTPETEKLLYDMNYTLSNSKYIQLSTHMSTSDIYWQCTILLRGLLDRKVETQFTKINLNYNVNTSSEMSIFESILILTIIMNWQLKDANNKSLSGDMYFPNGKYNGKDVCLDLLFNGLYDGTLYQPNTQYHQNDIIGLNGNTLYIATRDFYSTNISYDIQEGYLIQLTNEEGIKIDAGTPKPLSLGSPYTISSFDFDVRNTKKEFYESLQYMDYINPNEFIPMLDKVLDREYSNVGEVLMTDVKLIYKYLEEKLRTSKTIYEFRQTTDVFKNLFTVNPIRNWYDNILNTDELICDEYNLSDNEYSLFKSSFIEDYTDLKFEYNNIIYDISLFNILNYDVKTIFINDKQMFLDNSFTTAFINYIKSISIPSIESSTIISDNIKNNGVYKDIISDKIILDTGNTDYGPKTFEALLFRTNPSLYRYIESIKNNSDIILSLMKSIIKALENYTSSSLSALEFKTIGGDEYFKILKEVITYFKSYMVEYTRDEFVYIFGNIFDNGGNSDMLRLYDEIHHLDLNMIPKDSLTLFDVSKLDSHKKFVDNNISLLHDGALFRKQTTYQNLLDSGYDLWYDNGKIISKTPFDIDPSTMITANMIADNSSSPSSAYKIIINKNNLDVIPPNYYGNAR